MEFLFLSYFFKLYGGLVYNSIDGRSPAAQYLENVPNRETVLNIVITDNIDTACMEFKIPTDQKCIYVSTFGNKNPDHRIIQFLSSHSKNVFMSIYDEIENNNSSWRTKPTREEFGDMVDVYLEANLLGNYYIPLRIIRNDSWGRNPIFDLADNLVRLKDKYKNKKNEFIELAFINIKYMINSVCKASKIPIVYPWESVVKDIDYLTGMRSISRSRLMALASLILDESNGSPGVTELLMKQSINKYDYYLMYKLARVYEFKFNDRSMARRLLSDSLSSNKDYFRSMYKLGVYCDERDEYSRAFRYYENTIKIIEPSINVGSWRPNEMNYYIKTCARILSLNRFFKSEDFSDMYLNKIKRFMDQIKDDNSNKFINDICAFLYGDKQYEMKEKINKESIESAKQHIDAFLGDNYKFLYE